MPIPAQISETWLADYQVSLLDKLASILGWDNGSPSVQNAVLQTLLDYGVSDPSTVTGIENTRKLLAYADRAIWRAVVKATTGNYDFRDADASMSRSQMQEQAKEALEVAEAALAEAGGTGLSVGRLTLDFLEPATQWG